MNHKVGEESKVPYKDSRIKYTIQERRCTKCGTRLYAAGDVPEEIICDFCQMEEDA